MTELEAVLGLRGQWRERGQTVVWTNGCFDLFHAGHVFLLESARALGDILLVGLNSDASVRRLKGPGRPFMRFEHRAAVLASLRAVDHVVRLDKDLPTAAIDALRPDVCVKDDTYASLPLPERAVVEAYGGRMVLVPRVPGLSTSGLAANLRAAP